MFIYNMSQCLAQLCCMALMQQRHCTAQQSQLAAYLLLFGINLYTHLYRKPASKGRSSRCPGAWLVSCLVPTVCERMHV
jgi:hypothetical protein